MSKFAIINSETNIVENKIKWDGVTPYKINDGYYLSEIKDNDYVDMGYFYDKDLKTYINLNLDLGV